MNKDEILTKFKQWTPKTETIHIASLDIDMTIKQITANDYIKLTAMDKDNFMANAIRYSCFDDNDELIFDDNDIDMIKHFNASDSSLIFDSIARLNGWVDRNPKKSGKTK